MTDLARALLSPSSIALVGASDDSGKTAGRPLRFLRDGGYEGRVYPINPRRETVLGERAWSSLSALPEIPEHAFILAPTDQVIAAVDECGRLGVKVATILATGFSEAGEEGRTREARLREIHRETGLRILGPSSIGVVNLHRKMALTANAAFAESDLPLGGAFVASHSGSMMGALVSRGKARSLGFAGLVSVGNELDLTLGEICSATLDDPAATSYLLFLESLRAAGDLRAFAHGAAARGKPIVAYKLGRSEVGAELALSHTGAMAGEDDIADAFLAECGIARVETFEGLIETLPLLNRMPIRPPTRRSPRVGVVTTTGGGAAMVVDRLSVLGVDVARPGDETFEAIEKTGLNVERGRIVDLTLAGTRYDVMKGSLEAMLADPEFDLVVAVVGSSARFQPDLAVRPVIDSAASSKSLVAFLVPEAPDALAMLTKAGVPNFRTPESCADAIAAAFRRQQPRQEAKIRTQASGTPRMLDEVESYRLLETLGVRCAPHVVIETGAAPRLPFGYPVAVKLLSAEIAHKTDVGGVVLDVRDSEELAAAVQKICSAVAAARPGLSVQRLLVQQMKPGLGEALVGYRRDPEAGPIVLLAAGGVTTEIYKDRSIRIAPVDTATARGMISEVKAMRAHSGFRGRPPADLDALAAVIVALSSLASSAEIAEAEINPLILDRDGAFAVDALVRTA